MCVRGLFGLVVLFQVSKLKGKLLMSKGNNSGKRVPLGIKGKKNLV